MVPSRPIPLWCVGALAGAALAASLALAEDASESPEVPAASSTRAPDTARDLPALVTSYFKTDSAPARGKLAARISRIDGVSLDAVADAVRQAALWANQPPGDTSFALHTQHAQTRRRQVTITHVSVPQSYDPTRAYPLLLALHGENTSGEQFLRFARQLLGEQAEQFIIAAPTDYEGAWLSSTAEASEDLPALLDALKRSYHVDSDRVYLTGYSLGGHASFVAAALYADLFAAAVPLSGTFALQLGPEAADLLLPNLQHVPLLVAYGELDQGAPDTATGESSGIVTWNRYLDHCARALNLPLRMVELAGAGHDGITPPPDALKEILAHKRARNLRQFTHWFRYPSQGRRAWLRQTRFLGEPWAAQRLVVVPAVGEQPAEAVTAILTDKLACLTGRIDGQNIHAETRRCARLDLLLNGELVDLDREITIYVNGTKRFTGLARPRIATLLELAYHDWEFQKLWPVRFQLSHTGRAVQY